MYGPQQRLKQRSLFQYLSAAYEYDFFVVVVWNRQAYAKTRNKPSLWSVFVQQICDLPKETNLSIVFLFFILSSFHTVRCLYLTASSTVVATIASVVMAAAAAAAAIGS